MTHTVATATEMKNNFGRYLDLVMKGEEVIVTKNGKEVARFVPRDASVSYLTDTLIGVLSGTDTKEDPRMDSLKKKYEIAD
ncbi:MAG: type II toxin-antitoxin system prevent-host-death family antitoxin [Clostridia bacterium]|nr:type II toxin-antitoxin system prevent-host-death family antitoxin [Clostridia bacterium]